MTTPFDPNLQKQVLVCELANLDGARVLDIGCGSGGASLLMAHHSASVVGIDPDAAAIDSARAIAPDGANVSFQAAGVGGVEFPDSSFDVVVFMRSL